MVGDWISELMEGPIYYKYYFSSLIWYVWGVLDMDDLDKWGRVYDEGFGFRFG